MLKNSKIEKLYKIQKECVRYIANANKTTHTDPLFKNFKIRKIKDIIQLELLKFGYGIDHKIHPQPILDLFKKMEKKQLELKITNIIQGKKHAQYPASY